MTKTAVSEVVELDVRSHSFGSQVFRLLIECSDVPPDMIRKYSRVLVIGSC